MTLRGFMKKYYPSTIDKCCNGGVMGCPSCYKELGNRFDMCDDCSGLGTVCENVGHRNINRREHSVKKLIIPTDMQAVSLSALM